MKSIQKIQKWLKTRKKKTYFSVKRKNISESDEKLIEQTKKLTKELRNEMDKQNLNNYIKLIVRYLKMAN